MDTLPGYGASDRLHLTRPSEVDRARVVPNTARPGFQTPCPMSTNSLHLYRAIVREVKKLADRPVQRKLLFNARALFTTYKGAIDHTTVQGLHGEARAALSVIEWLRSVPPVSLGHSSRPWWAWEDGITAPGAPQPFPVTTAAAAATRPPRHPPTRSLAIGAGARRGAVPALPARARKVEGKAVAGSRRRRHGGGAVPRRAGGAVHRAHCGGGLGSQVQQAAAGCPGG